MVCQTSARIPIIDNEQVFSSSEAQSTGPMKLLIPFAILPSNVLSVSLFMR